MVRRFVFAALTISALLIVAAPAAPAAATALPRMAWPTVGRETQPFGCTGFRLEPRYGDCAHFHGGVDIANARGTPIRAAANGVISYVGREPWYHGVDRAWVVVIKHGNGLKTIYVHLIAKPMAGVRAGKSVARGQIIGLMGMTGRATGYHLHFGVKLNGVWVDPVRFMPTVSPALH